MDSVQFSQFLNQIAYWPKTQGERDQLAEKTKLLLNADFVVIFYSVHERGVSISFHGDVRKVNRDVLPDFLRDQIKQLSLSNRDAKPIQSIELTHKGPHWPIPDYVNHLVVVSFEKPSSPQAREMGFAVAGFSQVLENNQELLLIAISQYLAILARVANLESEIQIRNQFLSIASHELKTPLTSIYGILQLQERMLRAKKDTPALPDQERHQHFLKIAIRQVERLNELIDGLLDVSRIQNGRFMVEPSESDVASILRECIQGRLTVIANEAGVNLQVEAPAQLKAWVDPVRMEEVISNLVMNAIRFSPEGGVVWIRLNQEVDAFRLTVRDQGPSLPIEDRERIFSPFERAQRTGRLGGLGLGLYISRQIAQLHGGNVSLIESVPGKGNVFEAYFPIRSSSLANVT